MAGRLVIVPGLFTDDRVFLTAFARGEGEEAVLFATRSLLERWRHDLLSVSPAGVVAGRPLFLFTGLVRFLAGEDLPPVPGELTRRTVMAGLLQRLAAEGRLRLLGPLAGNPRLAGELALLYTELRRGLVPRGRLAALAREDPLTADLVLFFDEYEKTLRAAGWREEDDLVFTALRKATRKPLPFRRLLVHGFTDFTPLQVAFLQRLAEKIEITVLLPAFTFHPVLLGLRREVIDRFPGWEVASPPVDVDPLFVNNKMEMMELCGINPSALAFLVAGVIWSHLKAGLSPSAVAVVRRERQSHDGFTAALRRYGLPVVGDTIGLLTLNLVGTILAALDCVARDWPRSSVLRLARGLWVGKEAPLADELARLSAAAGVVRSRAAWETLLTDDRVTPPVREALTRLKEALSLIPVRGTTADYLRAIETFVSYWQFPSRYWPSPATEEAVAAYATEIRGIERFLAVLAEVAAAEEILPEKGLREIGEFAAEAFRLAGEASLSSPGEEGIRLLDPSEIRGLSFRLVFLVGLNEGEFPKAFHDDWLLPDSQRKKLRGRWSGPWLRRELFAREWQLLANVLAATGERLYLCRSETDGRGEVIGPSAFLAFLREKWGEIPIRRLEAGEFLPESLAGAWDREGAVTRLLVDLCWREIPPAEEKEILAAYEGERTALAGLFSRVVLRPLDGKIRPPEVAADLAVRFGPAWIMATSTLEDYALCPFFFFLRRILGLEEEKEAAEDPESTELGRAYHMVLERLFRQGGGELSGEKAPFYEDLLAVTVDEVFAPFLDGARTPAAAFLWRVARAKCLADLRRFLAAEIRRGKEIGTPRIIHCELGFGLSLGEAADPASSPFPLVLGGGELRLSGKIDRVDLLPDGHHYVVYDYKLGRVPSPAEVLSGRALQVPVYLLAGRRIFFPGLTPAGAGYYGLQDLKRQSGLWRAELAEATGIGSRSAGSLTEEEWEETLQRLEEAILQTARRLRDGDFRPLPPEEDCPSYCAFARICRKEDR